MKINFGTAYSEEEKARFIKLAERFGELLERAEENNADELILGERYNERYGFSWDEPEKEETYD